ncbi:hypothetical protein OHC33_005645 [Knufia fluminis]|uniref:Thioredoxin-like fold domain-containing protein n=1 Tax=Knufia fluminis TaxID=191047 RepID=A0AAN8IMD7_9EURO|nr:hypothetical protein OHC33_005645 [Knufia fluminis]
MSLKPAYSGALLPLHTSTPPQPGKIATVPHTLELYLDYVCPFSAKQFKVFYHDVVPIIKQNYQSPGVRVIFRQQIQPWHPSSTLVHEAGAAVLNLAPENFWEFSAALFEKQEEYFDVNVVHESRNQTYKRLAKLAAETTGVDEKKYYELLEISDKPGPDGGLNIGNKVTDDVKYMTKTNRLVGVHVTPTVLFNGWTEGSISSSWSKEDWEKWLDKNLK